MNCESISYISKMSRNTPAVLLPFSSYYSLHISNCRAYNPARLYLTRRQKSKVSIGGEIIPMLVGIDGTDDYFFSSERRNANYDATFADSFVSRICKPAGPGGPTLDRMYLRGPLGPGGGLEDAIEAGYRFILRQHQQRRQMGINEP